MSIYDQTEIVSGGGFSGDISGVSWYKADTESYLTPDAFFQIYLKHTSTSEFLTASDYNNEVVGATLVYESTTQTLPATIGWFDIPFLTPFTWNGTDNIMIITRWMRVGNGTGPLNWQATTTTSAKVSHSFNSNSSMGALYTNAKRPDVKLEFAPSTSIIENNPNALITIYPNPSKEILFLKKPNVSGLMSILNANGKTVIQQKLGFEGECNISTSPLSNGIYTLHFQSSENFYSKKFVVLK